jgi:hypothetical protein
MSIVVETSQGSRNLKEHLPLGDTELAKAMAKLDGGRTTVFSITVLGNILFVGGGSGRYTVSSLMEDGSSSALVGDSQAAGDVMMIIGGQQIPQPVRYIVDADRALKVAKHFSRTGHLDEEEPWEEP